MEHAGMLHEIVKLRVQKHEMTKLADKMAGLMEQMIRGHEGCLGKGCDFPLLDAQVALAEWGGLMAKHNVVWHKDNIHLMKAMIQAGGEEA